MKTLIPVLSAFLFAASTGIHAQTPPSDSGKGPRRGFDCSKAQDPKACEERRAKIKEAFGKARQACEGKQGPERRDCMQSQLCAQAKDPAKCNERADRQKQRMESRRKAHEACKDKQGDERRSCMREQRRGREGSKS